MQSLSMQRGIFKGRNKGSNEWSSLKREHLSLHSFWKEVNVQQNSRMFCSSTILSRNFSVTCATFSFNSIANSFTPFSSSSFTMSKDNLTNFVLILF